jgi:hypothetical protein
MAQAQGTGKVSIATTSDVSSAHDTEEVHKTDLPFKSDADSMRYKVMIQLISRSISGEALTFTPC